LEYYRDLMYAADAFISPFSTMAIEAAFCGKPTLTIGYSDNVHEWKLEYAMIQDHVKPLLTWKHLVVCLHEETLLTSLKKVLNIVDINHFASEIRDEVGYIIFSNRNSYSANLLTVVSELEYKR
jgi:predicted glycosyltransferase